MQKVAKDQIIHLDKIDKKLIYELDCDSRQSNIQIAKKLRISKDSVKYRIERLEKKNIITGFYAELDAYRLGYFAVRILVRFQNITIEKEKGILNELADDSQVAWVHSGEGNWDLLFGFWVKDIFEAYRFQEKFYNTYGNYIENKLVSIYHRMYQFKKDYLVGNKRKIANISYMGGQEKVKIDELDSNLLSILVNDGRKPLYELANELGVSSKVIAYRVKRLKQEKVILAFRPMINLGLLGHSWFKIHLSLKNIDEEKQNKLFSWVSQQPNTIYIDEMIGGYDFEIDVDLPGHVALRTYIEKLRDNFSDIVKDFETLDCFKAHKNLVWFPR